MKETPAEIELNKLELDEKIREYSKVIEMDILKEYKLYYPINNASKTISSYNLTLKV